MIESIIFYTLAIWVIASAGMCVSVKNVFHAALWLIMCLCGVAGVYAMLAADFLFAVQLLVYAGGVMVVMLFVVLLSGTPADWKGPQLNKRAWGAILFALFFVALIITTLSQWPMAYNLIDPKATTAPLGDLIMGKLILPLEVVGLVLLVSLIGAIFFSSKRVS